MTQNTAPRLSRSSIFIYELLSVIIVLGAWLRLATLDYREVWYDEAYSGLLVRQSWPDMFALIRADVHPPVYYVILKSWVAVAGSSDFALRLPSAVAGILLIPAAFWFMQLLQKERSQTKNSWISLGAAYLIAINPFLIEYSQEARGYTLVALFMTLAAGWFWRAWQRSPLATNRDWLAWSLCLGLAFLTHYLSALGIIVFIIIGVWTIIQQARQQRLAWRKVFRQHIWTLLPALIFFVSWLQALWQQLAVADPLRWIPSARIWFWFRSIAAFLFGVDHHALNVPQVNQFSPLISSTLIGGMIGVMLLGLSIYVLRRSPQTKRTQTLYLLALWVLPIAGVMALSRLGIQWYVERYLIAYGVFFLLFVVWILGQARWHLLALALVIYSISWFFLPILPAQPDCYQRCTYVAYTLPDTRTVTDNPFNFFVLRYYFPERDIKLYDLNNANHYTTWDMVKTTDILTSPAQLQTTDHLLLQQ